MAHCPVVYVCKLQEKRPHASFLCRTRLAKMSEAKVMPHKKVKGKESNEEEERIARKKRRKLERRARKEAERSGTSFSSSLHKSDKGKSRRADTGSETAEEQRKEKKRRKKEKKRREAEEAARKEADKQMMSRSQYVASLTRDQTTQVAPTPVARPGPEPIAAEKKTKKKTKKRTHEQVSLGDVASTSDTGKGKEKEVIASEPLGPEKDRPKKKKKKRTDEERSLHASNEIPMPAAKESNVEEVPVQEPVHPAVDEPKKKKKKKKDKKAVEKDVNESSAHSKTALEGISASGSRKDAAEPTDLSSEKRSDGPPRSATDATAMTKPIKDASTGESAGKARDAVESRVQPGKKSAGGEKRTKKTAELPKDTTMTTAATTTSNAARDITKTTDSRPSTGKRDISKMIDDAIKKSRARVSSSKAATPRASSTTTTTTSSTGRRRTGSDDADDDPSSEGNLTTKEGVLADAALLTHKEMLTDRLYRGHQLNWLKEETGLKVKQGKFSNWELEQVRKAIADFKTEQGLSDEDFLTWLFMSTSERGDQSLYTSFWRMVTASVEDRPNRGIRLMVRRMLKPRDVGAWTDEEQEKLANAIDKFGQRWPAVAKAVGNRTAEDCRLRWRDYSSESVAAKKTGAFSEEEKEKLREVVHAACAEVGIEEEDVYSPSITIPWKRVSQMLNGERNPNVYSMKWLEMQSQEHQSKKAMTANASEGEGGGGDGAWTDQDTTILLERLSQQERALERDDFTEVTLSKLRSSDWLADMKAMRRIWRQLVGMYTVSTNYKTNFRSNLAQIKSALATGRTAKKRRQSRKDEVEDLIDTDEEE